jgi:hypothetical protein
MSAGMIEKILGPIIVVIVGWLLKAPVMRETYVRILKKLEDAENELDLELRKPSPRWGSGKIIDVDPIKFPFSLSQIAKRAKVWLWLARWAKDWESRQAIQRRILGK